MTTSFTLSEELQKRIEALCSGTESVSQWCYKAAEERANRLEARDERARKQTLLNDVERLKPAIIEILKELKIV